MTHYISILLYFIILLIILCCAILYKNQLQCFTNIPYHTNKISETDIIIVSSHNNRMKCFFSSINGSSKNFNNCSAILCTSVNNKCHFEMIFEGNMSYDTWTLDEFNKEYNDKYFDIIIPPNRKIILLRHAKGIHNGRISFAIDPPLTEEGYMEAKKLGLFLKSFINNSQNIIFGASKLIRTQMTISIIQFILGINKTITIIPCIDEIISCTFNFQVNANTPAKNYMERKILMPFCHDSKPVELNWKKLTKCNNMKTNIITNILNSV